MTPNPVVQKSNKRPKHTQGSETAERGALIQKLPDALFKYIFGMLHSKDGKHLWNVAHFTRSALSTGKFKWADKRLELALVMDATNSMGPYINNAKLFLNLILKTIAEHRLIRKANTQNGNGGPGVNGIVMDTNNTGAVTNSAPTGVNGVATATAMDTNNAAAVTNGAPTGVNGDASPMVDSKQAVEDKDYQLFDLFAAWEEFRDYGDVPHSRLKSFTRKIEQISQFIQDSSAHGGGDTPEDVAGALWRANEELNWTKSPHCHAVRILTLVLDAEPHGMGAADDDYPNGGPEGFPRADWLVLAHQFKKDGIIVNPVLCHQNRDLLNLFGATIAEITGGTCVALENPNYLGQYLVTQICYDLELDELLTKEISAVQGDRKTSQDNSTAALAKRVLNSITSNAAATLPVVEGVIKVAHKKANALAQCVTLDIARERNLLKDPKAHNHAQLNGRESMPGATPAEFEGPLAEPFLAVGTQSPSPSATPTPNPLTLNHGRGLGLMRAMSTMGPVTAPIPMLPMHNMMSSPAFTPAVTMPGGIFGGKAPEDLNFGHPLAMSATRGKPETKEQADHSRMKSKARIPGEGKASAESQAGADKARKANGIDLKTDAKSEAEGSASKLMKTNINGCVVWQLDEATRLKEETRLKVKHAGAAPVLLSLDRPPPFLLAYHPFLGAGLGGLGGGLTLPPAAGTGPAAAGATVAGPSAAGAAAAAVPAAAAPPAPPVALSTARSSVADSMAGAALHSRITSMLSRNR